ncbi:galactose oxidase-like domain-containing protein [Corallococcus sp. M7]
MLRTWRFAFLAAWTFTAVARAQAPDPAVVGKWSAVQTWPYSAVHTHLLPTGKVMWFSEFEDGDNPHLWDPQTNVLTRLPKAGFNIFCAGHAFLPDGRLLVAGGHIDIDAGLRYATLYNPFTNTWTRLPSMNAGRWYPTVTTLPNGEMLVTGGAKEDKTKNLVPQVWQPSKNAWRSLSNASLELMYYPWNFVAPDGRTFMAGYWKPSRFLATGGTGAWTTGPRTRYPNSRNAGSAALYEPGKVLITGGDNPPTNNVEVIDLNAATPAWRSVAPMRYVRRQHNSTLLPDGTVLVTGGHSGPGTDNPNYPRYETELWNPATETWSLLAPISAYRGYHSTTLLLPDGRVLSAGGRGVRTQQVFSPPYLFKGTRPSVSSAPASVAYGQTFRVATPDAARISKVSWIKLGSVTHAFDENQRFQWLKFTRGTDALTLTAPSNANMAPPGHYLLFLLDTKGVPSVGKIVRIGGTSAMQEPASPPPEAPSAGMSSGAHAGLMLESPNGGETLRPGYAQPVQWMIHDAGIETVRLQFSPDNGAHWTTVKTGLPNTGFYSWTVPSTQTSKGLLRIADAKRPHVSDQTDAPFTISASPRFQAVAFGEYWKFDDRGVDPGRGWMSPGFDDSAWRSGPGKLGYGIGDEHTVLTQTNPRQRSLYFRKKLTLWETVRAAHLRVLHDDGVALWVNGKLVYSRSMGNGFEHDACASGAVKQPVISTATVDGAPFVVGENILTVMLKQANGESDDAAFDLELNLEAR